VNIILSKHALEQMELRQISLHLVNDILANPDEVLVVNEKTIYQSVIIEHGKSYLIRIFVNNIKNPNLVITVYKTSKISKYYEGEI
jgi:Domain of unknown function (DUF4258)